MGQHPQRYSLLRAHRNPIAPPTTAMYAVRGPSFRMSPGMAMTATIRSQPHPATTRSAESGRRRSLKSVKNLPKENKRITHSGTHLDSHESKTDYRRALGDQLVMDRAHTDLQNALRRGPTGGTA